MRYIQTSHYRLVNFVVLVLLLGSMAYSSRHGTSMPHTIFVVGVLIAALLTSIFVRPKDDIGPINVPRLSLIQVRVIAGVLLVLLGISLVNFYALDPGYFQPHKKRVLAAVFALIGLFAVLYGPSSVELMKAEDKRIGDDA